jgi:hypothetical protein
MAARWSPEQRAFEWRPGGTRSELILDLWVLWLVLYSMPVMAFGGGYIVAAAQLATAVACILLCFVLTRRVPVSQKNAIRDSIVAGVFITLLACVMLLPGGFLAILPLRFIWVGFVWGWISGEMLWRFFQVTGVTPSPK